MGSSENSVPILDTEDITRRLRLSPQTKLFAFYSSVLGGITLDHAHFQIPLDDHIVHRGHAVFDTCTLVEGRLYRLTAHLKRLLRSAEIARITHPWSIPGLRNIITQTCSASGKKTAGVRYWLSVGPGGFGLSPDDCRAAFYVAVFDAGEPWNAVKTVNEITIDATTIPMKPQPLSNMKSTNYMLNCLGHMYSRERGGHLGLWLDDRRNLAEGSIASIMMVTKGRVLRTPSFSAILPGVTALRVLEKCKQLVQEGFPYLKGVEVADMIVDEAYKASELFYVSGDTHVTHIARLNGRTIGDGKPGPVARRIFQMLDTEARSGSHDVITVLYASSPSAPAETISVKGGTLRSRL